MHYLFSPFIGDPVQIIPYLDRQQLNSGEYLWQCGDKAQSIVIVHSGKLHALRWPAARNRSDIITEPVVVEVILPGAIIGYLHALSSPPANRVTSTLVVSPAGAVVYTIKLESFRRMSTESPQLALGVLQAVLQRSTEEYTALTGIQSLN